MNDPTAFLGTGWAFPPQFGKAGTAMVSGEDDIHQSLLILLSTALGERILRPRFGCGLRRLVFEILDDESRSRIVAMVTKAIQQFEARVSPLEVRVDLDETIPEKVLVRIEYTVRATNSKLNLVYPFYLDEAARG